MKVGKLTNGEKLFISRRRICRTQSHFASFFNMSRSSYSELELDKKDNYPDVSILGLGIVVSLMSHEKCVILRRRSNLEQYEVADDLGVSRYWVNQMELGKVPCKMLTEYWS